MATQRAEGIPARALSSTAAGDLAGILHLGVVARHGAQQVLVRAEPVEPRGHRPVGLDQHAAMAVEGAGVRGRAP